MGKHTRCVVFRGIGARNVLWDSGQGRLPQVEPEEVLYMEKKEEKYPNKEEIMTQMPVVYQMEEEDIEPNVEKQPLGHLESEPEEKAGGRWEVDSRILVNDEFVLICFSTDHWKVALKKGFRDVVFGELGSPRQTLRLEPILFSDTRGWSAIIDTGASKSVIGQEKVEQLLGSLPDHVQKKISWRKSDIVFCFGNNAILSSVGAIYVPFGKKWICLEVFAGSTPFLLSNVFLKAIKADVWTSI